MQYEDRTENACKECNGRCCMIYLSADEGGMFSGMEYWEDWVTGFHEGRQYYGVEPLYNSELIHISNSCFDTEIDSEYNQEISRMKKNNLSKDYCEYRHPEKGCIIPLDNRPSQCNTFFCPNRDVLKSSLFKIIKKEFEIEESNLLDWFQIEDVINNINIEKKSKEEEYYDSLISLENNSNDLNKYGDIPF